jgi:hypothetical protein
MFARRRNTFLPHFGTLQMIQLLLWWAAGTAMTFTQFAGAGVGISAI